LWSNLLLCKNLLLFSLQQDKSDVIRPKRKYEKKPKVLPSSAAATPQQTSPAALPVFNAKDLNQYDFPSSDEEPLSQVGSLEFSPAVRKGIGIKLTHLLIPVLVYPACILQVLSGSSEAEEENDPDGPFAFRRKAGCQYYAVSRIFLCIVRQSVVVGKIRVFNCL